MFKRFIRWIFNSPIPQDRAVEFSPIDSLTETLEKLLELDEHYKATVAKKMNVPQIRDEGNVQKRLKLFSRPND